MRPEKRVGRSPLLRIAVGIGLAAVLAPSALGIVLLSQQYWVSNALTPAVPFLFGVGGLITLVIGATEPRATLAPADLSRRRLAIGLGWFALALAPISVATGFLVTLHGLQ